jgi:hypothetical protein
MKTEPFIRRWALFVSLAFLICAPCRAQVTDWFTEGFDGTVRTNDLQFHTLTFTPNGTANFYSLCQQPASAFPTDPTGGNYLLLGDDDYAQVFLSGGQTVAIYNTRANIFYIGSNGYLTMNAGDATYIAYPPGTSFSWPSNHFNLPRVSAWFDDLNPDPLYGGSGTISWKQTSDRVAVTYQYIKSYYAGYTNNSFQIELFYDGRIQVTYLQVDNISGLVGLSAGQGVPAGFAMSDFDHHVNCSFPVINTSVSPVGAGTVNGTGGGNIVSCGQTVTVGALPNPGYSFLNWTENGNQVSASSSYSFTAFGNRNLKANFVSGPSSPRIIAQPQSRSMAAGSFKSYEVPAVFGVIATGTGQLYYQWQFNGKNIPNATGSILYFNSIAATNFGNYSVIVSNAYGSVTSASATLAVLTDGSNGNKPAQTPNPTIPPRPSGKDSLIVITHGWEPLQPNADLSWMTSLSNAIAAKMPGNWVVTNFVWLGAAWDPDPQKVLNFGSIIGAMYGNQLASQGWSRIHFIGHSAGSALIESAAKAVQAGSHGTVIHCTFLDPFMGELREWQQVYGSHSTWSDCYFAEDPAGGFTSGGLANAYNVDVSWVDPSRQVISYGTGVAAFSSHGYPHDFYQATVTNMNANWCGANYGFALSEEKEGLGWNNNPANYPTNNLPLMLCGAPGAVQNPNAGLAATFAAASLIQNTYMGLVNFLANSGVIMVSPSVLVFQSLGQTNGVQPHGGGSTYSNTPAWLAVGVTVVNPANLVQFDAGFNDTNSAQGLLTVYWNTNQIGFADERAVSTNSQTYHFMLPATVSSGVYTLSFRLDSFNGTSSSVVITNVATGFIGVTNPVTLGISLTNGLPMLQLTAPTNFNYLVQSSTNLVNWTPAALLFNTNGTVQFIDSAVTNSPARFYRALMP